MEIECPFCLETDFDLIGLKHHLLSGYCEDFNLTPLVGPMKKEAESE